MNDAVLLWIALACSVAGLALLFFAHDETATRHVLNGTVIGKQGRAVLVDTVVLLQARNMTVGKNISVQVFWDGKRFVAVQ